MKTPDSFNPEQPSNNSGWFKAIHSKVGYELWKANRCAFFLAWAIAERARYSVEWNRYSLEPGEALLGDVGTLGMTAREYRTGKRVLEKAGFATFKTTNQGTIAKLNDSRLYGVSNLPSDKQNDKRPTSKRQAPDNYQEREEGKIDRKMTLTAHCMSDSFSLKDFRNPKNVQEARDFFKSLGCSEENSNLRAGRFVSFNDENGWQIDGSPIRDWRAAARTFNEKCEATGP